MILRWEADKVVSPMLGGGMRAGRPMEHWTRSRASKCLRYLYLDYHSISFGEFEGLPVPAFEGTSMRRPTEL